MADDGDDRPNPEEFKVHMRMAQAGEDNAMRHDDFVGSYNNTGRVKLDKKTWTPNKPADEDNAFKSDDWMGSGKTQRKSWKVKSPTNVARADEGSKPGEFVRSNSDSGRKWKPPPKDQAVPPPWMGSPTQSSPKRASTPVNASDHTKESSEHAGDMSLSELQNSNHSHVKDEIERLPNSFSHASVNSSPRHSPRHNARKPWQSHGALPRVDLNKADTSKHEDDAEEVEPLKSGNGYHDSESDAYEVASDDGFETIAPSKDEEANPSIPSAPAPPATSSAAGYSAPHDDDRPDPEEYKAHMRTLHAGEDNAMRHDDFVGSYNNTGRVKLDKKKWAPTKPDEEDNAFKSDDWMGSGKTQRKSWKPKSSKKVVRADDAPKPDFVRSENENTTQWAPHAQKTEEEPREVAPTEAPSQPEPEPEPVKAQEPKHEEEESESVPANETEDETEEESESAPIPEASDRATPPEVSPTRAATGYLAGQDDDRPDPEEFKVHMRTVHASEDSAMRHDDFVGSYNNTGRVKLDKKKWAAKKPDDGDNAFRSDDWMGSGKTQRKSWKVKS